MTIFLAKDLMKLWNLKLQNILHFVFVNTVICFICQGPPGTRGPEGRQGEKGTKVSPELFSTFFSSLWFCIDNVKSTRMANSIKI